MEVSENLKILLKLNEGLVKLKQEIPPNFYGDNIKINAYLSGINNSLFLSNLLLENNGQFPKSPFDE